MSKKRKHTNQPLKSNGNKKDPGRKSKAKSSLKKKEIWSFKNVSFNNFIPLLIALIFFSILWFRPLDIKITDPWYEGIALIDSANKVTEKELKNLLLDEAGEKLSEQVRKHPYHARVHYLYGYYWLQRQNWDSVIYHEREAIRIGAGGVVEQVEFKAQEMLNYAIGKKVNPLINSGNNEEALKVLEYATTKNMNNPEIDRSKGIIYLRKGDNDRALGCFLRYEKSQPNNVLNLTNIGLSYMRKNNLDSARFYINRAIKLDPNHNRAKQLNAQLNPQNQ